MMRRTRLRSIFARSLRVLRRMLDGAADRRHPSAFHKNSKLPARLLALPSVLACVARESPAILRYFCSADPGLAADLQRNLGLSPGTGSRPVPDGLFRRGPTTAAPADPPIVVVPVFNAFHDTARLLDRLPQTLDDTSLILLVDDGSTDPRIAPLLGGFRDRQPDQVMLLSLPENRGFVGAVNAGFAAARKLTAGHVVLLNTDTLPPRGWLPRLLAPILADGNVATVTPMSNNAEILSVPANGVETRPDAELVDAIDAAAQGFAPDFRGVELPTGIGFCMAMNRRYLHAVGQFDPAFGRGYGEEVDWCRKAAALGGRHVGAADVFVGHRGGASFGGEKSARLAASAIMIRARYPDYDAEVAEWVRTDPLLPQRLALGIAWLGAVSAGAVPVWLAHSLGGGAEIVLRRELDAALSAGAPGGIVIRVGGPTIYRLELHGRDFHIAGDLSSEASLHELLAPLASRRVVYSCGVGAADPPGLPALICALARKGDSLEFRVHDYFPVSPSYCLLDSDGRYRGVPDIASMDLAHAVSGRTLAEWRALWAKPIRRADDVTCFSEASSVILRAAYPESAARITVIPHPMPDLPPPLAPGGTTVGVLGALNRAKGAKVIERLARHLGRSRRIAVIGQMDPAFRLPRPHRVHGTYRQEEIANLARTYGVGLWLMPSVWPETFSFAAREALATGLPVLAFPLGAQAEAVAAAPNGRLLTSDPDDNAGIAREIEAAFAVSKG